MTAFDKLKIGDTVNTSHGECTVTNITWRKHIGPQYDVRFADGECCRYGSWQMKRIMANANPENKN